MPAIECPFCKTYSNFTSVWAEGAIPPGGRTVVTTGFTSALRCNNENCGMVVVALLSPDQRQMYKHWPALASGKDFPDVPPNIASAANEAHICVSVEAYRGAIALARAVVESTAKDQNISKGTLNEKINALAEQAVISAAMRDAAHEIRFAGNEVAHGDLAEEGITADDAREVLGLMDAMLLRIYQEPAQVERVRRRRQERSQA